MSYIVSRAFEFSASHQLFGLPDGHKCSRLHGHTYHVELAITGDLDEAGMVIDFARLDWVASLISEKLDHRHLNDALEINPTAENLANWIARETGSWLQHEPEYARLVSLEVRVRETPRTYAAVDVPLE